MRRADRKPKTPPDRGPFEITHKLPSSVKSSEVAPQRPSGNEGFFALVPEAIEVVRRKLRSGDLKAAALVLKLSDLLMREGRNSLCSNPNHEWTATLSSRQIFTLQMLEMVLCKDKMFGLGLRDEQIAQLARQVFMREDDEE